MIRNRLVKEAIPRKNLLLFGNIPKGGGWVMFEDDEELFSAYTFSKENVGG